MSKIEYRVRTVTRYIVTEYTPSDETKQAHIGIVGEFDNEEKAQKVAKALGSKKGAKYVVELEDL